MLCFRIPTVNGNLRQLREMQLLMLKTILQSSLSVFQFTCVIITSSSDVNWSTDRDDREIVFSNRECISVLWLAWILVHCGRPKTSNKCVHCIFRTSLCYLLCYFKFAYLQTFSVKKVFKLFIFLWLIIFWFSVFYFSVIYHILTSSFLFSCDILHYDL